MAAGEVHSTPPALELYQHCEAGGIEADALLPLAQRALPLCLERTGPGEPLLPQLECVEISLISDEAIAAVHGEFMDDPTATDVITFQHGEILVSVETAARSAGEQGHEPSREALLYVIHGFLHLNGFEDHTAAGFREMKTAQEEVLKTVSPLPPAENRGYSGADVPR